MNAHPLHRSIRRSLPIACATAALLLSTASVTFAQPTPPPDAGQADEGREGRREAAMLWLQDYRELIRDLNLTAEQRPQLREAMQKNVEAMRSLQQDAQTMSPQDRAASLNEAIDQLNSDISAVLTEEQRKTFEPRAAAIKTRTIQAARQQARGNAATRPATEPATRPAGGRMRPGERVEAALEAAEVTAEQRTKLQPALDTMRQEVTALVAEGADGDRQAMRGKMREIIDRFMSKASEVLSPEQMEKLRTAMRPGAGNRRPEGAGDQPGAMNDAPAMGGAAHTEMTDGMQAASGSAPRPKLTEALAPDAPTLALGDSLPDFTLTPLDGREVTRAKFIGKPGVILFGSYTAPSFRDGAPLLQQLAKRHGSRVNWLIVYTREMHPTGSDEPERNRDDRITVAAHTTIAERSTAARMARDQLRLAIDIAPDMIDDAFTRQLGGFPNAAFVFDAAGKLVAKQQWADVFAIERALNRELKRN